MIANQIEDHLTISFLIIKNLYLQICKAFHTPATKQSKAYFTCKKKQNFQFTSKIQALHCATVTLLFITTKLKAQCIFDNTQLQLFSFTEASSAVDSSDTRKTNIEFGDLEMLLTAQGNDKSGILSELILISEGTVETDRMMLRYQFSDTFHISVESNYNGQLVINRKIIL